MHFVCVADLYAFAIFKGVRLPLLWRQGCGIAEPAWPKIMVPGWIRVQVLGGSLVVLAIAFVLSPEMVVRIDVNHLA